LAQLIGVFLCQQEREIFSVMVNTTLNQIQIEQWMDCGCNGRGAFVAAVDTPM
jgi:hypothetical protein